MPSILIVGGLTIDVFSDGRRAPGGSVIHAGIAAVADGAVISTLTVGGPEPEADAGRAQLASFGMLLAATAPSTTTFGHAEVDGRRVLTLEAVGGHVAPDEELGRPDVVLFAPIADELEADAVATICEETQSPVAAFLIQGWLRHLVVGQAVHPMQLGEVPQAAWDTFGAGNLVVVSNEDLAESPEDPFILAAGLRARLGPRPVLVVTLGTEGYLLDDPRADRIVATVPRRVVSGVATVGAGDTFGVVMALRMATGLPAAAAADAGTDAVIALLESRR